jgi:predicted nuclease of predicted toxin-antitoxin system
MGFALLLDENVEREVLYRLRDRGHDAEHVASVDALGKGATDAAVAAYSRRTGRAIVSYDDDFRTEFSETDLFGFVFVPDGTLSSEQMAVILDAMSDHYEQRDLRGAHVLDDAWL